MCRLLRSVERTLSCWRAACNAQDLYTRVVRQRDLFRKLLQDSAGDPAGAASAAAAAGAITLRPEAISTPPRVEVRDCPLRLKANVQLLSLVVHVLVSQHLATSMGALGD